MELLADGEQLPSWAVVLIALCTGGALTAIWKLIESVWDKRSLTRRDANSELGKMLDLERANREKDVTRLQAIIDRQDGDIKQLLDRAGKAETAEARCRGEVARLESDVRGMNSDIRRLQERIYDTPPGVSRPCQIIASVPEGVIAHASAEAGSMFHWLPDELVGQKISILMPRDIRPIHGRKMEKLISEGRNADQDNGVRSFGVTKEGKRFPVIINLSGPWDGKDGARYINAEIRRRGDSDVMLHGPTVVPNTAEEAPTVKAPETDR